MIDEVINTPLHLPKEKLKLKLTSCRLQKELQMQMFAR